MKGVEGVTTGDATILLRKRGRGMYTELMRYLSSAKRAVIITTAFLDRKAALGLKGLASKGVKVYVVTLLRSTEPGWLSKHRSHRDALLELASAYESGLPVYCYVRPDIHDKLYIVDLEVVARGSLNLSSGSDGNIESLEVVKDEPTAVRDALEILVLITDAATRSCSSALKDRRHRHAIPR